MKEWLDRINRIFQVKNIKDEACSVNIFI